MNLTEAIITLNKNGIKVLNEKESSFETKLKGELISYGLNKYIINKLIKKYSGKIDELKNNGTSYSEIANFIYFQNKKEESNGISIDERRKYFEKIHNIFSKVVHKFGIDFNETYLKIGFFKNNNFFNLVEATKNYDELCFYKNTNKDGKIKSRIYKKIKTEDLTEELLEELLEKELLNCYDLINEME